MQNPGGGEPDDGMLPEYDFSEAEVGKYAERYARAFRTVRLDPDVAEVFSTSEAVNDVLRAIAGAIRARELGTRPA
ncbi:hypothetical protein [Longimicrobium sp.]|uniref:hypothetical protein n=1 Tax=Longimicrobium sp. TaxID=2029185 RepID=UPI002C1E10ED|nr:hypothetical protein [Longimicrobium sp.]HSU13117.1 hypothetical protein [Longimicrobium sp.]